LAAVTFDLWHTLIQLAPSQEDRYIQLQEATLAEILRASSRSAAPGQRAVLGPEEAARRAYAEATARKGLGVPLANLAVEAARWAGREPNPTEWVHAIESLVDEQPFEEVPGAKEQLRRLVDQGWKTAVVSNLVGESGRSMRSVMRRLGLARFIHSWAFSEELPWAKPAPEIFWHALEPIGVLPRDAVHIGDLGGDVQGARAAGFRGSVLFRGARQYGALYAALCHTDDPIDPPPDRVLASWDALPPLLDSLFARGPGVVGVPP
jgi:FMN phosphatase YigB (HAD superfamily)